MAKGLTMGQRAAIRAAFMRRGELGLTQKELAEAAGVTERTIQSMESYKSWPRSDTLHRLERLGLKWPTGHMTELAARTNHSAETEIDEDVAAILDSNLHPDVKLRLIDRLRKLRTGDQAVADQRSGQHDQPTDNVRRLR